MRTLPRRDGGLLVNARRIVRDFYAILFTLAAVALHIYVLACYLAGVTLVP